MKSPKLTKYGDLELTVKFPVFSNYKMFVVFSADLCASRLNRYGDAGAGGELETAAFVSICSEGCHIFLKPSAGGGLIAHESFHAIRAMFLWAGVEDFDNEIVAYHLGYLVDKIVKFQLTNRFVSALKILNKKRKA